MKHNSTKIIIFFIFFFSLFSCSKIYVKKIKENGDIEYINKKKVEKIKIQFEIFDTINSIISGELYNHKKQIHNGIRIIDLNNVILLESGFFSNNYKYLVKKNIPYNYNNGLYQEIFVLKFFNKNNHIYVEIILPRFNSNTLNIHSIFHVSFDFIYDEKIINIKTEWQEIEGNFDGFIK